MQYKLILGAVAALSLAACSPAMTPPVDDGSAMSQESSVNPAADDSDSMVDDDAAAGSRVVDVTVTDWSFSPMTIIVKQGENVSLRLVGEKGIHSLLVADLGLNVRVEAGESPTIAIPTDKTGTFAGRCGVPCGPGHRDMKFTIVVE